MIDDDDYYYYRKATNCFPASDGDVIILTSKDYKPYLVELTCNNNNGI